MKAILVANIQRKNIKRREESGKRRNIKGFKTRANGLSSQK